MNSKELFSGIPLNGADAGELLAGVGMKLIGLAQNSDRLRDFGWHDSSNPILQSLAIEGFVNGCYLSSLGPEPIIYRSSLVDEALQVIGMLRSDLKDLSRSAAYDAKIESASWAEMFRRSRLEESSEHPTPRNPKFGDTAYFDLVSWVSFEMNRKFHSVSSVRGGVLTTLMENEGVGIYGFLSFRNQSYPVVIKPYLVLAVGSTFDNLSVMVSSDRHILHPIWPLSLRLGELLVSRNREQLIVSLSAFSDCFMILKEDLNNSSLIGDDLPPS